MLTLEAIMARTKPAPGGCRIWQGARSGEGYPQIRTGGHRGGKIIGVHRAVVELTTGKRLPPGGRVVAAHRQGCSTLCVAPGHVRRATQVENCREGDRWR